jgi:hypothetical protein
VSCQVDIVDVICRTRYGHSVISDARIVIVVDVVGSRAIIVGDDEE